MNLDAGVADGNIDLMTHCGLGMLDLSSFTNRTTFNNTYFSNDAVINNNGDLKCLACKPGYIPD